jgi:hypothetical protein
VVNPVGDVQFARVAERLVDDGNRTPDALQAALRRLYARAVVRRRVLSDEAFEVWYVYREGRWVPRQEDEDPGRDRSTWTPRNATI